MKQALKFLVALCVAIVILFAVRAYAFTIYTVPADLASVLRKGDRVLVNRMARDSFSRGDLVVFQRQGAHVGRIVNLPPSCYKEPLMWSPLCAVRVAVATIAVFISSVWVSKIWLFILTN